MNGIRTGTDFSLRTLLLVLLLGLPLFAALGGCNAEGDATATENESGADDNGDDDDPQSGDDGDSGADDPDAGEDPDDPPGDNPDNPPGQCAPGDASCDEPLLASCGPGERFLPLVNDHAELGLRVRVRDGTDGGRCRGCSVRDEDEVVENNLLSSARMRTPAGTTSSVYITVSLPHVGHGMNHAGFMVADPEGIDASGVLDRIDIAVVREGATVANAVRGDNAFKVFDVGDSLRQLVMLETTEGFDGVRIRLKGHEERDNALDVYAACVDRYGW